MTDESESTGFLYRLNRDWWLFLIALAIPASVIVSWYLSKLTQSPFIEWVRIVSLVGSLILSLVLAFLYQGFKEIQGQQSEVMKNQEELMEAEHKPELELDQVEASSSLLICYLSNVGKGTASELRAVIETDPVPESDLDFELRDETIDITRYNDSFDSDSDTVIKISGSFVRPNESRVSMYLPLAVGFKTEVSQGTTTLSELAWTLAGAFDDSLFDVEDDSEIREETHSERKKVEVRFEEGNRLWTSMHPKKKEFINDNDLGIEIQDDEEREFSLPKRETIRRRTTESLDFDKLRVKITIQYSGPELDNKKELEVIDKVIPFGYEEDTNLLFDAGMEFERYKSRSNEEIIRWNLARKMADEEVSEETSES